MKRLTRERGPQALRVAGMVLVAVLAIAGTGAIIRAFQSHASTPSVPVHTDGLASAWTSSTASGPLSGAVVRDGTLYVGAADGIIAYRSPCVSSGHTCQPLWHDRVPDGPVSTPAANQGIVYAGSAHGRVYAFPSSCSVVGCDPLWRGNAGRGRVSTPGANDDFVYVTSNKLYAFPASCRSDRRICPTAWTGPIPGHAAAGPPAVSGGVVVVASSGTDGGVVAYPAVCVDLCQPAWRAATGGPATGVTASATTAYVVSRGRLLAFPLSCSGTCRPSWVGPFAVGHAGPTGIAPSGAIGPPAVEGDRVAVGGSDGRLWVFPASCDARACGPTGRYRPAGHPLHTPVIDQDLIIAASADGMLGAVDVGCDPPDCVPPWSAWLGTGVSGPPVADRGSVYVADDLGIVHAFVVRGR